MNVHFIWNQSVFLTCLKLSISNHLNNNCDIFLPNVNFIRCCITCFIHIMRKKVLYWKKERTLWGIYKYNKIFQVAHFQKFHSFYWGNFLGNGILCRVNKSPYPLNLHIVLTSKEKKIILYWCQLYHSMGLWNLLEFAYLQCSK